MGKLKYLGSSSALVKYRCNTNVKEVLDWIARTPILQVDTETTIAETTTRQIILLQLGDVFGNVSYVIQKSHITNEEFIAILEAVADRKKLKIIQNVDFDYNVIKNYGVYLENVWDTMVMEQCIYGGHKYDLSFYALAEMLSRRYGVDMSKGIRTEFGDNIITDEKLIYAAKDVVYLGRLYQDQQKEMKAEGILHLGTGEYNENEARLAFSDISYNGMYLYQDKWIKNITWAEPFMLSAKKELEDVVREDIKDFCNALEVNYETSGGYKVKAKALMDEDTFVLNWNSAPQRLCMLKHIFPELTKASTLELKKYLSENDPSIPPDVKPTSKKFMPYVAKTYGNKFDLLKAIILGETKMVEDFLLRSCRGLLIEQGFVIPKGTITVNWNSPKVKLEIFKQFNPAIESTDAESVEENLLTHKFFRYYKQYSYYNTLLTKYGEKFIEKNVDTDGRVRTRFNTILATGRVSSSSPNVQQIPSSNLPQGMQGRYRECFGPGREGWLTINCDYSSQELAIISTLSKDPVFMYALTHGMDIHSCGAEVVYGQDWLEAAEDDCAFYALDSDGNPKKQKCNCPKHKALRQNVKAINFGLCYGQTEYGLAVKLHITEDQARDLIARYFKAFPSIRGLLDSFAAYGKLNGYIKTVPPMARKRYFPHWKGLQETPPYLMSSIGRASMNTPIQGSAADMVKIALIRIRRRLNKEGLNDVIELACQIHDEITMFAKENYSKLAATIVNEEMEEAAFIVLGNRLLKAEPEITEFMAK